jgi:hypothetical protein
VTPEEEKRHGEVVGGFMITFGHIEAILCVWAYELTKDQAVRDKAIGLILSKRLELVCDLVRASSLSEHHKKRSLELWDDVSKFSKMRNKIAHSPLITNRENQTGFIDLREFKGVLDGNPIPVAPLTFIEIATAGSRLLRVIRGLDEIFKESNGKRGNHK